VRESEGGGGEYRTTSDITTFFPHRLTYSERERERWKGEEREIERREPLCVGNTYITASYSRWNPPA
jgi:hypothetical protein